MATGGDAGSSTGASQGQDRSYFGHLTGRYLVTYDTWRAAVDHRPQTTLEYAQTLERSQTVTCAGIAALHYQIKNKDVRLRDVTGIDSHVFERRYLGDPNDSWLCFHANFSALLDNNTKVFFFAEIVGTNSPQVVITCVKLMAREDYSVKNCRFCTGMWHPVGVISSATLFQALGFDRHDLRDRRVGEM